MADRSPRRPEFRNVSLRDLFGYMRAFPSTLWVSLLHRVSGVLMFLLLPAVIWAFDASVSSEYSFARLKSVFEHGAWIVPGWFFKLVILALIWAMLHHLIAGLRFLVLDTMHAAVDKQPAQRSARFVLIVSVALTALLGAKLFGLY